MPVAKTKLERDQVAKLLSCVHDDDHEQIDKLTTSGVPNLINYSACSDDGETALCIAAAANNDGLVFALLQLGAHPDVVDQHGRSPVMYAAKYGHVQCVQLLAKAGADMKICDDEGKGVLFYCFGALTTRHKQCTEIVLAQGADVNNCNRRGIPVFLHACEAAAENKDICLMLLRRGADPTSSNVVNNRTAVIAASASGGAEVVSGILDLGADANEVMVRSQLNAVHEASRGGHLEVLKVLSGFGAKFNEVDDAGNSALHFAATAGHGLCCRFLAQRGCNPKTKNLDGKTPRLIAKDAGHKEAMKELRRAENTFGKAVKNAEPWALMLYDFCCTKQHQLEETFAKYDVNGNRRIPRDDFAQALMNTVGAPKLEDADLNKVLNAHDRDKAIDYAEFLTGKKYINKAYLASAYLPKQKKSKKGGGGGKRRKGATAVPVQVCVKNVVDRAQDGGPPVMFVDRHIHLTDLERFDRDRSPRHPIEDDSAWYMTPPDRTYVELNHATRNHDMQSLMDAVVTRGLDVDTRDMYYKTPLMVACSAGNIELVRFLITCGANINVKDNFMWTPLHFACHAGAKAVVELLLELGAQLDPVSTCGATPLMKAIEACQHDIVQCLLDKGAKLRIENKKGLTPLHIASDYGDYRLYCMVKEKLDALPPIKDKKGAKPRSARPRSRATSSGAVKKPITARPSSNTSDVGTAPHKSSILRAASALAGGLEETEDITYCPQRPWVAPPTSQELIQRRVTRREHYGWRADFDDFKLPFLHNIDNKLVTLTAGGD